MNANHRVCDPMMIRFRFLLIRFLYAAALLEPPLPGPYLRTYLRSCNAGGGCFGIVRFAFLFLQSKFAPASEFSLA
jgi:hypothetical protein